MNNKSLLNNIISNIEKKSKSRNILILPSDISKNYIQNLLQKNNISNAEIFYLDDYVFKLNDKNKKKFVTADISFLEDALNISTSIFNKYNLTNEIENILAIINNVFKKNNICSKLNFNEEKNIFNDIKRNTISQESKIFFEIFKIWLDKSKSLDTYIGNYLELLNSELLIFSDAEHHVINIDSYENNEKDWIVKYLPNNNFYANFFRNNIYSDNFVPENLSIYESYDFQTQEDELEYIASDINQVLQKNKNSSIALINNDRYFARRLRALLERKNIEINDYNGWLLSTSACCSYIDSILRYYIFDDNYINLNDVITSPYFLPSTDQDTKNNFLREILNAHKNNINVSVSSYIKTKKYKFFDIFADTDDDSEYTFLEFKYFIEEKINNFQSYDILIKDNAGIEFFKSLRNIEEINRNKKQKYNLVTWYKKLSLILESKTFKNFGNSNIDYLNINHANLYSYDKVYVNSMTNKNFPKKIINNFSINNVIYEDLSITSNQEHKETIEDFLNISNNAKSIMISSHNSDGQDIFSKSKFKIYIDHFLNQSLEPNIEPKKYNVVTESVDFSFNKNFLNLNYRDIENFNTCKYCCYLNKIHPKRKLSIVEENPYLFGNFVHLVLEKFTNSINLNSSKDEIISDLKKFSDTAVSDFYYKDSLPYEISLWDNILPKIAEYFHYDLSKKKNFTSEKVVSKQLDNGIILKGKYDLKYSLGNEEYVVDYKTGSYIPSRLSVTSGASLQLPFYSILVPEATNIEYLSITVSNSSIKNISFSNSELLDAKNLIFDSVEAISSHVSNNKVFHANKSSSGCKFCGFEIIEKN